MGGSQCRLFLKVDCSAENPLASGCSRQAVTLHSAVLATLRVPAAIAMASRVFWGWHGVTGPARKMKHEPSATRRASLTGPKGLWRTWQIMKKWYEAKWKMISFSYFVTPRAPLHVTRISGTSDRLELRYLYLVYIVMLCRNTKNTTAIST